MLDFLELEETVGRAWHRLVGETGSLPRFPEAAVALDDVRPLLGPLFRGFGGDPAVQIAPAHPKTSGHRLRLRQLVGLGEERIARPGRDFGRALLPETIDIFADRALNRDLYLWLTAVIAALPETAPADPDPLRRDLARIEAARDTVGVVLGAFPGLRPVHARLCGALLAVRRRGRLPDVERLVEARVVSLLKQGAGLGDDAPPAIFPRRAPAGYQPMLDVPLWPEFLPATDAAPAVPDADTPLSEATEARGRRRFAARREDANGRSERSPFILNRFEKILSMAEMINVDRPTDDDADTDASAAEDLDELALGRRRERPSSRFRFDLDLPPQAVETEALAADLTYPEWDYRKGLYLPNHCRVLAVPAEAAAAPPAPGDETRALIRKVRRQFEALRPRREMLKARIDGADLDLDAVVRHRADLAAGGEGSDRIHLDSQPRGTDLSVTILVDVSLSTDAWVDERRVLDVEKEALLVLAHGLAAADTDFSVLTFTSRRRSWVRVETVKTMGERMSPAVEARIAALKPGYYTRLGAALRHAVTGLKTAPGRTRLLLVLTDGKPNDVDHYEGRFALEDSRRAVQEARRAGISVFAVTVDRDAKAYLPMMFGRAGHAVIGDIARLPAALPAIYRGLTS